jgi:hypothetical protein
MAAFVHPENQKIIWNIVNSNPYVAEYFVSNKNISRESWFRNIIEKFYSQHQDRNLSVTELNQLNKDTLSFMIQSIHNTAPNFQSAPPAPTSPEINPIKKTEILTPPIIENTRQQQSIYDFQARQQEYDSMTKKNIPDEIDFKEGNKDEAIQDMDSLIQKHMKEREEQLQLTPPPNIMPENKPIKQDNIMNVSPAVSMPENTISINDYGDEIKVLKKEITDMKELLQKNNELLLLLINKESPQVQDFLQQTDEPGNIETTIIESPLIEDATDLSLNVKQGNENN